MLGEKWRLSRIQKERLARPRRKTNVIVHWLTPCQPPPAGWICPPPRQPCPWGSSLFAQVGSDTDRNEPLQSISAVSPVSPRPALMAGLRGPRRLEPQSTLYGNIGGGDGGGKMGREEGEWAYRKRSESRS